MRALIVGAASCLGAASSALALGLLAPAAALAQNGPACAPATLNNSALLDGAVTVSPLPGSRDASPWTQISFMGVPAGELSVVSVVGSVTGEHGGRLAAYSQGDGASFLPGRPFAEGERVTVRALLRSRRSTKVLLDTFAVAHQDAISSTPETIHPGSAAQVQSFHSRPDLHPPVVTVTAHSPEASTDDMFVAPYTGPGQAGPMILDQNGSVVWFKPLPRNVSATNLQVQEYAGKPVLTWWEGDISVHGFGLGDDVIDDSSYTKIAQVKAGDGLQADLHEFRLTPRGTALITAYDPILCDLSSVGGPAYGAVTDAVFQEIDVRTGLVRFQWTSVDHVAISETYSPQGSSVGFPLDFFHINGIAPDPDGSLLVSARNTWTIYDVDGRSGQIHWRLGGKHSSFAETPAARTAWQHDPQVLPDGSISIFDNGSYPTVHAQSRGIVLELGQGTATLLSQLTHGPPLIAESQGSLQALGDGNWFVGWGQVPDFSEFGPSGTLLFDAHLPRFDQSYRSFRFPWVGQPTHRPSLAFKPGPPGAGTAYASWNGATLVSSWRLLAGSSPSQLAPVAVAPHTGFESAIALPAGTPGRDLAVEALNAAGGTLGVSVAIAESVG